MKFKIKVRNVNTGHEWWEDYDKVCDDARKKAEEIINYWNDTISEYESPRELLKVVVLDSRKNTAEHDFKKINCFTKISKGASYDVYRCSHCGVTGKRFGLSETIVLDSKFRAKLYSNCEKAKAKAKAKINQTKRI